MAEVVGAHWIRLAPVTEISPAGSGPGCFVSPFLLASNATSRAETGRTIGRGAGCATFGSFDFGPGFGGSGFFGGGFENSAI